MFKLALQKAEEPEIRLTTSVRSSKKQESSRKTSMSALLTMPKLLIVFSLVQLLSRVRLFVTPWTTARQASLSITNSPSSLRLTSIESVMPSSHLILCHPLLLLPLIFHSIKVFSMSQLFVSGGQSIGVSASASDLPMNIQDWYPLGLTGLISLLSKGL